MVRPYLLQPKHELFRSHHERLRDRPDPARAAHKFAKRLKEMRHVHALRIACYVGLYFATAATALSLVLRWVGDPLGLGAALQILVGVSSSVTAIFLLGVLLTTRILGWIEVELHFYSQESRLPGLT